MVFIKHRNRSEKIFIIKKLINIDKVVIPLWDNNSPQSQSNTLLLELFISDFLTQWLIVQCYDSGNKWNTRSLRLLSCWLVFYSSNILYICSSDNLRVMNKHEALHTLPYRVFKTNELFWASQEHRIILTVHIHQIWGYPSPHISQWHITITTWLSISLHLTLVIVVVRIFLNVYNMNYR